MRFARLQGETEAIPAGLEDLVAAGDLDLLQLDYLRPRSAVVEHQAPPALPAHALGFAAALRALTKTLYLEPQFRVVASAGWESAFECVERAAGTLIEGGCGDVPMAAVRGSNLLPILEMMQADGVKFENAETGAPLRDLREPLLAADLEIGAGPLATALAEEARVIVAGCYDGAAPATAAAVTEFHWKWSDFDRLAAVAAAARAALWYDWQCSELSHWRPSKTEVDAADEIIVETSSNDPETSNRLQHWLASLAEHPAATTHVDVRVDSSSMSCTPIAPGRTAIEGTRGLETDCCWRVDILYQAGFAVDAMVEFTNQADAHARRQLANIARSHLTPDNAEGVLTVEELQTLSEGDAGWLHLTFQSKSRRECQHVLDQMLKFASAHRPLLRLATAAPAVRVHCGVWPARIPRGVVDVAVETRLAKEWV